MPIAPLPKHIVRAIGSCQVLSDSVSVVKELVDNALDGRASSIVVEISVNVLDVIQVKDDGHGIAPDDRGLVCQRYCTSKITEFKDVSIIGGSSLGFRGEALASAVDMSGNVIVTTRIEGEPVASRLEFNRLGNLLSQDRVSHPVGTTVRVVDFLKHLPVRKQTWLKASGRLISRIKAMLKAYALARPLVRFSLKVLKAKSDKENWMYAAKTGATVVDAALKILGPQVVSQCQWQSWTSLIGIEPSSSQATTTDGAVTSTSNYNIESLLPRNDCDVSFINNAGHYVSIDSRPMSCDRGVLKQIIALHKSYLKSCLQSCSSITSHNNLTDPFLCMNIKCPPGSYDPNIEPAKDDVLFLEPEGVLQTVERFFTHIYGQIKPYTTELSVSDTPPPRQDGFDLLLRRKDDIAASISNHCNHAGRDASMSGGANELSEYEDTFLERSSDVLNLVNHSTISERTFDAKVSDGGNNNHVDSPKQLLLGKTRAWSSSMYDGDEDDDCFLQRDSEPHNMTDAEDEESVSRNAKHFNPWTIAKMNAPVVRIQPVKQTEVSEDAIRNEQLLTPDRNRAGESVYSFPRPPLSRNSPNSLLAGTPPTFPSPASSVTATEVLTSSGAMPFSTNPWAKRSYLTDVPHPANPQDNGNGHKFTSRRPRPDTVKRNDFVLARSLPTGTPLANIPDMTEKRRDLSQHKQQGYQQQQGKLHKPFVPPVKRSDQTGSGMGPIQPLGQVRKVSHSQEMCAGSANEANVGSDSNMDLGASMHPDLAATLDFESRKLAAMHGRKAQLHQQTLDMVTSRIDGQYIPRPTVPNSPHRNRYIKAIGALSSSGAPVDPQQAVFTKKDPRGNLVQMLYEGVVEGHNDSIVGGHKLKRQKTAHLPFESVPIGQAVHDLVMTIDTSASTVAREATRLTSNDEYIECGSVGDGLKSTKADVVLWNGALRKLLEQSFRTDEGRVEDVVLDLWTILQTHHASLKGVVNISDT